MTVISYLTPCFDHKLFGSLFIFMIQQINSNKGP